MKGTKREAVLREGDIVMGNTLDTLVPGTHVEVMTKHLVDGHTVCGTVISAAANTPGAYIVEYHPGLDNGQHIREELKIIPGLPYHKEWPGA
jgi:hypothetical protein